MPVRLPTRRRSGRMLAPPSLGLLDDRFYSLLDDMFGETEELTWLPATDVTESDGEIVLTTELPGLARDDVEIEVEENMLRIRGEKREEREEERVDGELRVSERRYGSFSRAFTLPSSVDPDNISARMKNGVLEVRLPKTEKARGRRIEIQGK